MGNDFFDLCNFARGCGAVLALSDSPRVAAHAKPQIKALGVSRVYTHHEVHPPFSSDAERCRARSFTGVQRAKSQTDGQNCAIR